ncbi:hypothetical protein [Enterocloster lavalensis]|uniref:hypothetical protein n=1 Tax=Enterocloster lavalensis TaxID=460384 RepID=UPI00266597FF|nr:hypothetical protein [Enterocloster lavalensis]
MINKRITNRNFLFFCIILLSLVLIAIVLERNRTNSNVKPQKDYEEAWAKKEGKVISPQKTASKNAKRIQEPSGLTDLAEYPTELLPNLDHIKLGIEMDVADNLFYEYFGTNIASSLSTDTGKYILEDGRELPTSCYRFSPRGSQYVWQLEFTGENNPRLTRLCLFSFSDVEMKPLIDYYSQHTLYKTEWITEPLNEKGDNLNIFTAATVIDGLPNTVAIYKLDLTIIAFQFGEGVIENMDFD